MTPSAISRRTLVQQGGAALAGLSVLRLAGPAHAFQPARARSSPGWTSPSPTRCRRSIVRQLDWEQLDSWLTPNDEFFVIKHFNQPELNETDWRLEIGGLVEQPMTLTPGRPQSPRAPGGDLHPGVLRQHRAALLHRRRRQRDLGGHAAGAAAGGGGRAGGGQRGRLLGRGRRRAGLAAR